MKRTLSFVLAAAMSIGVPLLAACPPPSGATTPGSDASKIYPVPTPIASVVTDDAAFKAFAKVVRTDIEKGVSDKDPAIAGERLFVLSMLDALDNKWDEAIESLDKAAALEPTPEGKQMLGLTLRVWGDARTESETPDAFRAALDARLSAMKLEKLGDQLVMLRTMATNFTPEVCGELVATEVGPHVKDGKVAIDDVHAIVFQRYAVVRLVPVGKVIDEVLGARGIASASAPAAP